MDFSQFQNPYPPLTFPPFAIDYDLESEPGSRLFKVQFEGKKLGVMKRPLREAVPEQGVKVERFHENLGWIWRNRRS